MSKTRKSFPLRISEELFQEIKEWAEHEMRSVNGQIEYVLRQAVRTRKGSRGKRSAEAEPDSEES